MKTTVKSLRKLIKEAIGSKSVNFDVEFPDHIYSKPRARMTIRNATMRLTKSVREELMNIGAQDVTFTEDEVRFVSHDPATIIAWLEESGLTTMVAQDSTDETGHTTLIVGWKLQDDPEYHQVVTAAEDAWLESLVAELAKAGLKDINVTRRGPAGGNPNIRGVTSQANYQHVKNVLAAMDPITYS